MKWKAHSKTPFLFAAVDGDQRKPEKGVQKYGGGEDLNGKREKRRDEEM